MLQLVHTTATVTPLAWAKSPKASLYKDIDYDHYINEANSLINSIIQ